MQNFIFDLPFADYLKIERLNSSTAAYGLKSMKHLKGYLDGDLTVAESREITIGKLVHAIVENKVPDIRMVPEFHLGSNGNVTDGTREIKRRPKKMTKADDTLSALGQAWVDLCSKHNKPSDFDGEIFTGVITGQRETDSKITKHYKAKLSAWFEQHKETVNVFADEFKRIKGTYEALANDPTVTHAMSNSKHEVTVLGDILGVPCKIRLDGLRKIEPGLYKFWDTKTTSDCETEPFCKHCFRMNYHFKMTFYHLVLKSNDIIAEADFIAVESDGVHDTNVLPLRLKHFEEWEPDVLKVVQAYKDAKRRGSWPGRYDKPQEFFIPPYEMKYNGVAGDDAEVTWGDDDE